MLLMETLQSDNELFPFDIDEIEEDDMASSNSAMDALMSSVLGKTRSEEAEVSSRMAYMEIETQRRRENPFWRVDMMESLYDKIASPEAAYQARTCGCVIEDREIIPVDFTPRELNELARRRSKYTSRVTADEDPL